MGLNAKVGFDNIFFGHEMAKHSFVECNENGGKFVDICTALILEFHYLFSEQAISSVGFQLTGNVNLIRSTTLRSTIDLKIVFWMCKTRGALTPASSGVIN